MTNKNTDSQKNTIHYSNWYQSFFGSPENTSYSAWTDNISNVFIYYYYGTEKTIVEITFENDEIIEVTLDELCSQSKMREKMEEKFRVIPPLLTPSEYEMAIFVIITSPCIKKRRKDKKKSA
jgi:hypothetical protein